jgi:cytochrome c peroxidase
MTASRSWPALVIAGTIALSNIGPAQSQEESFDWLLPKAGLAKQTPILFVSPKTPAAWNALKGFWNPSTIEIIDNDTGEKVTRSVVKIKLPLGLSDPPPVPLENPMTVERWDLGRKLYFDPILSSDATVSCASCHNPKLGYTDQLPVSTGINAAKGGVSAPTVMNSAYSPLQFWDGRAASLEEQAQGPVGNPVEMFTPVGKESHAWNDAIKRVRKQAEFVKAFEAAFGHAPTRDAAAKAIATYERTVLSGNSIHDRAEQAMKERVAEEETGKFAIEAKDYEKVLKDAVAANDKTALAALNLPVGKDAPLSDIAKKIDSGRALFFGKARCSLCHVGQNFSDGSFHNLGVGVKDGKVPTDGLGRFAQQPFGHKNPEFYGAFKTPILRGLVSTAPYMHDGSEKTLEQVVDFYDRGGNANPHLSPKMRDLEAERAFRKAKASGAKYTGPQAHVFGDTVIVPMQLRLTPDEKTSLVMFLRSLEGEVNPLVGDPRMPALVK